MAGLRRALRTVLKNYNSPCFHVKRLLNYTGQCYDGDSDPGPIFINPDVQGILQSLTRVDYDRVFRKRKLGTKKPSDPEYKFMTDAELQEALRAAKERAAELLQIPPVVKVRNTEAKVVCKDPELQGLESSRMVFTDITFGVQDEQRIVVVREPDGTLREAEWAVRQRVNQTYFPDKAKQMQVPRMFLDSYLERLLDKNEYEYVLDRACVQFEPDDPDYQRLISIVYQHLNDHNKFELLRSTRHFGSLTFYLVWNRNIDNLLLELIQTMRIEEADQLLALYSLIHQKRFEGEDPLDRVQSYIEQAAGKKGSLELAVQAYKDVAARRAVEAL
ncbi:hypothetical protein HUJ04_005515 [Dendroctonus ponderosae]